MNEKWLNKHANITILSTAQVLNLTISLCCNLKVITARLTLCLHVRETNICNAKKQQTNKQIKGYKL